MITIGELHFAIKSFGIWDQRDRGRFLSSLIGTLEVSDPCFVLEIDDETVNIISPKGVGWVYVGAFSYWRQGEII